MNAEKGKMCLICERAHNNQTKHNKTDKVLKYTEWPQDGGTTKTRSSRVRAQAPFEQRKLSEHVHRIVVIANLLARETLEYTERTQVEHTTSSGCNYQNMYTTVMTTVRCPDVPASSSIQCKRESGMGHKRTKRSSCKDVWL